MQYGRFSFHDPINHISFGVVVVFTRGQIEDSRVWRLMRLMSVMMMSVMMHNSDLRDSGEYKKKKVWGVQIFTMQSRGTITFARPLFEVRFACSPRVS